MNATISYGKGEVAFYRTYATPLSGLMPIPESDFVGRGNTLFAAEVCVEVLGDNFLPAYTDGDNSNVVATDTMKNFVLGKALEYQGATLEGFLDFLGRQFLSIYPQMQSLRLSAHEAPFAAVRVPDVGANAWTASNVLFSRLHGDHARTMIQFEQASGGVRIVEHQCGQVDLQWIKVTGSSFASFVRDAYTTLPERRDRPLFIFLDASWRYRDVADMLAPEHTRYVAAEQVRDLLGTVFHQFVSKSIQHLLHEMGSRLLDRFPQLAEISFEAQNRLWDTALEAEDDPRTKVYCDPRPPYGIIRLTLSR